MFRHAGFRIRATAQTPCGLDDFPSESLFERGLRAEVGHVAGREGVEDVLLFGADEVDD